MVLQVRVLGEAARADVTLERPRAAVHVHVRFEVAGRRERFRAQAAFVRFFLSNDKDMEIWKRYYLCFVCSHASVGVYFGILYGRPEQWTRQPNYCLIYSVDDVHSIFFSTSTYCPYNTNRISE